MDFEEELANDLTIVRVAIDRLTERVEHELEARAEREFDEAEESQELNAAEAQLRKLATELRGAPARVGGIADEALQWMQKLTTQLEAKKVAYNNLSNVNAAQAVEIKEMHEKAKQAEVRAEEAELRAKDLATLLSDAEGQRTKLVEILQASAGAEDADALWASIVQALDALGVVPSPGVGKRG